MSNPISKEDARKIGNMYAELQQGEQRLIEFLEERSKESGAGYADQDDLVFLVESYNCISSVKLQLIQALQEAQDAEDMALLAQKTGFALLPLQQALGRLEQDWTMPLRKGGVGDTIAAVQAIGDTSGLKAMYPADHWGWKIGGPELNPELHPKKDGDAE